MERSRNGRQAESRYAPKEGAGRARQRAFVTGIMLEGDDLSDARPVAPIDLTAGLTAREREVLALMGKNPFPDKPPKFIRAVTYNYEFTNREMLRKTGDWWRRTYKGIYMRPVSLNPSENAGFTVADATHFTTSAVNAYCPQHLGEPTTEPPPPIAWWDIPWIPLPAPGAG